MITEIFFLNYKNIFEILQLPTCLVDKSHILSHFSQIFDIQAAKLIFSVNVNHTGFTPQTLRQLKWT